MSSVNQLSKLVQGKEVRLVAVDAKGKDHYGRIVADVMLPEPSARSVLSQTTDKVIVAGASTGGTEALREVLPAS